MRDAAHVRLPTADCLLRDRFDAKHRAFLLVGEQIQQAVWTLTHVADSLPQLDEERLSPQLLHLLVEQNPLEMAGPRNLPCAKRADEDVALPFRRSRVMPPETASTDQ
jgi:hypothetical protein